VWSIIFFYKIQPKVYQGKKGGDALLVWLQHQTSGRDILITNLSAVFEDGMILCALVDSFYPNINFDKLAKYKKRDNINLALETASQEWGIPKLLDVEDILSGPDELSMITYLSVAFDLCTYNCVTLLQ